MYQWRWKDRKSYLCHRGSTEAYMGVRECSIYNSLASVDGINLFGSNPDKQIPIKKTEE